MFVGTVAVVPARYPFRPIVPNSNHVDPSFDPSTTTVNVGNVPADAVQSTMTCNTPASPVSTAPCVVLAVSAADGFNVHVCPRFMIVPDA
jgi:hypothetical protein